MWTTALTDDKEYKKKVIQSVWNMINETKQRVPLADLFHTDTAEGTFWDNSFSLVRFTGRSVVGGFAITILEEEWK